MPRSRKFVVPALVALFAGGSALVFAQDPAASRAAPRTAGAAQPARGQAKPAPDPAQMTRLLQAWERQSAKLQTLDVRIYRIDRDFKWGDEHHFEGRAVFKSPGLAYLDFWKLKLAKDAKGKAVPVVQNGKRVKTHVETIVCAANDVWQYLYDSKQIFVFPLAKGQRQRALEEGPLPFLFNMKAQEAEARYEMALVDQNAEMYVVKVTPKLQEDKESFKVALLYLTRKWLLPSQVALINADGKSSRVYHLSDIKPNAAVDGKIFVGGALRGWKVEQNPAGPRSQAAGGSGAMGGLRRR